MYAPNTVKATAIKGIDLVIALIIAITYDKKNPDMNNNNDLIVIVDLRKN
jgi:hypothetical protein